MPGLKLYELADEYALIDAMIAENDGEITPEIEARLDAVEMPWKAKVENLARLINERRAEAEATEAEARRIKALAASRAKAVEGLKDYLKVQLQRAGAARVDTDTARVSVCKNSRPSINVLVPVESLPPEFRTVVTTTALNRERVDAALAAGELPEGIEAVQGYHVRIR